MRVSSKGTVGRPLLRVWVCTRRKLPKKTVEQLRIALVGCLGAEQDLREFYRFAERDPILKHVTEDVYGMHDTQGVSLFNWVILSICLQMARPARSIDMMGAINLRYGDTIEFD